MTTKWVVTTATERLALDQTRTGEVTFTVTNQSTKPARAVFDVHTGEGVDESWFTIEDPQRPIRPAASVPYLVRIHVGPQVPPGSYEFEARVSPPDAAPEENFVLSRRVILEVPAPPAPTKKKWPWWIFVAAALLALVISIVTWLVWPSGTPDPTPTATPSVIPSTAPIEYTAVPRVLGLSPTDAAAALQKAGLVAGAQTYRLGSGTASTVRQSIPAGAEAAKGSKVDLEIAAPATRPVISAPNNGSSVAPNTMPTVAWTQVDPWVSQWMVTVAPEQCTKPPVGPEICQPAPQSPPRFVTSRQYQPPMPKLTYSDPAKPTVRHSGWINVTICVIDDVGNNGECAAVRFFLEH